MLQFSERSQACQTRLAAFMDEHIYPNEHADAEQFAAMDNRFA